MFAIGDKVIYSFHGICKVHDIVEKEVNGVKRSCYQLRPIHDVKSTIFTPVDNQKVLMRSVATKEEALRILDSKEEIQFNWTENVWKRNQEFKKITNDADLKNNTRLYQVLLYHQMQLGKEGKKLIVQDSKIMDVVENMVVSELQAALGLEQKMIRTRLLDNFIQCIG